MKERLDAIVEQHNLLNHPFYQAWSAGTLPVEALKTYAEEYGAFIAVIPQGWAVQGDEETEHEEQEHRELWDDFASALNTQIGEARLPETKALMQAANDLFLSPVTALGALYAFEVQQPATAQSKLEGLKAHYQLPAQAEPYFEVHSHNHHEAEKILDRLSRVSAEDQATAATACERMSKALWDALSGIYSGQA